MRAAVREDHRVPIGTIIGNGRGELGPEALEPYIVLEQDRARDVIGPRRKRDIVCLWCSINRGVDRCGIVEAIVWNGAEIVDNECLYITTIFTEYR